MGKSADFSLLRVAGRGRDAIDGLTENTLDVIYRSHGSHDGAYRIHPRAAANGVQIVDAQFANFVVHASPPVLLGRSHPLTPGSCRIAATGSVRKTDRVIGVTNLD